MATYMDVDCVKYLCSCGNPLPVCQLYLCRHCLKLQCGDSLLHEVDTPFCPNCLESMGVAEAKLKRDRCVSCFDCPSCGHTLTTRATSLAVPSPDDPSKNTTKKMYYLSCGFCRWTTRDVGIPDQTVASGGWEDLENLHTKRISIILDHYRQLAQKEKAEKNRKKYIKKRSHLYLPDKYGLSQAIGKKKSLSSLSNLSITEKSELIIDPIAPGETVTDFEPLPESYFTEPLEISKVSTMQQRFSVPEFQPANAGDLHPVHKHFLIRRSLRCRECEHNLIKADFNPLSIKFKIQLVALHQIPEIRILKPAQFHYHKDTQAVMTVLNPSVFNTSMTLLPAHPNDAQWSTAKIDLPKGEIVLARRDDSAIYDDASQVNKEFKDNPKIIAFRKANKLGFFIKVNPQKKEGDVRVAFILRHNYHNTATTVQCDDKEPQVVWFEHRVYITLGKVQ